MLHGDACVRYLQLQWELGSPVFGFLLRKYAPHDTYQVLHLEAAIDYADAVLTQPARRLVPDHWH